MYQGVTRKGCEGESNFVKVEMGCNSSRTEFAISISGLKSFVGFVQCKCNRGADKF